MKSEIRKTQALHHKLHNDLNSTTIKFSCELKNLNCNVNRNISAMCTIVVDFRSCENKFRQNLEEYCEVLKFISSNTQKVKTP